MSSYCDERADVYDETWRRAIKPHTCHACHRTIAKGERYARIFIAYDRTGSSTIRCVGCQTIHLHLRTLGDGEMWPDERLNCGEEYAEHWGREPPELIAALAFATPDEALRISEIIRFRAASHTHFRNLRYRIRNLRYRNGYRERAGREW